jgi:[ribosomal protein S18]-alanine N-acetyltransferase
MSMSIEQAGFSQRPHGDFIIRAMIDADVTGIMKIETRAYAFPWTAGIFRDCMGAGYCCHVLERNAEIIAYAVMSLGAKEAHILNICVSPDARGEGYGYALMDKLLALARQLRADMMFLEVRPSNEAARRLYDKLGFNEIGTRRNYYPAEQGREDALILAKQL